MGWYLFAVTLFLICSASMLMALPLDTGFSMLPFPMGFYVTVTSALVMVLMATIWLLRSHAMVVGGILMVVSAATIVASLSLANSVTEVSDYARPTPESNKLASLVTGVVLLILGIVSVARPVTFTDSEEIK